ncbi:MAG: hypothetical protein JW708_10345 [Vallitaleaceae bacterium]|nr:hypothetical protein [Vallitaleaceae bacterium]
MVLGFTMVSIAIFTGAIRYGITIDNILRNLPDALPWFLLLFTLLLAWEYELIGGLLLLLLGIGGLFYISSSGHTPVYQIYLMRTIMILSLGFIISWAIRRLYYFTFS